MADPAMANDPAKTWPPPVWAPGLRCDAQDKFGGWYQAKIMLVDGDKVKVHFKGWGREDGKSKWDEWMEQGSERMCALDTKSAEPPEEEDVSDSDDGALQVARLVRKREADGVTEYRVRWSGQGKEADEWVPDERLKDPEDLDCADMVKEFEAKAAVTEEKKKARLVAKEKQKETPAKSAAPVSAPKEEPNADYFAGLSEEQTEKVHTIEAVTGSGPEESVVCDPLCVPSALAFAVGVVVIFTEALRRSHCPVDRAACGMWILQRANGGPRSLYSKRSIGWWTRLSSVC
jgi:hypothetical protein